MPDMLPAAMMFEDSERSKLVFAILARNDYEKEPFMSRCYKFPMHRRTKGSNGSQRLSRLLNQVFNTAQKDTD
jgi:hypothetical protein